MGLQEVLNRADDLNARLWEAAFGHPYPAEVVTHKTLLLIGFIDTALEHHSAIIVLIRSHLCGSAMALVRPVFEMMLRGTWAVEHASESDAQQMLEDRFKWPTMETLASQSDSAYGTERFFKDVKVGSWGPLNSFAHTGSLQVARRFTGNDLRSDYPERELVFAAKASLIAVAVLVIPFLRSIGRMDDATQAEAIALALAGDADGSRPASSSPEA